jgi:hypothetical protein
MDGLGVAAGAVLGGRGGLDRARGRTKNLRSGEIHKVGVGHAIAFPAGSVEAGDGFPNLAGDGFNRITCATLNHLLQDVNSSG